MNATALELVYALLLVAVVALTSSKSCEPEVGIDKGTLKYPPSRSDYDRNVDCEWSLKPKDECDRMTVTVEYLDTEKDRDVLEIVDSSTNRVLANLSGPALYSSYTGKEYQGYPSQYVACSAYMTIRFKSDSNWIRGKGFRISYTTHRDAVKLSTPKPGYVEAKWTLCGSESRPACLKFYNIVSGSSLIYAMVTAKDGIADKITINDIEGPRKTVTSNKLITVDIFQRKSAVAAGLCGSTSCRLSSVPNGVEDEFWSGCGLRAMVYCNSGYFMYNFNNIRECKLNGEWDRKSPSRCTKIECSVPSPLKNGRYIFKDASKSKYYHNERIEFKCIEGYYEVGPLYKIYLILPCLPSSVHVLSRNNKHYFAPGSEWSLGKDPDNNPFISKYASPGGHISCGINGWRNGPDCQKLHCFENCINNGRKGHPYRTTSEFRVTKPKTNQISVKKQYPSTSVYNCISGFTLVGHSVATCMANSFMSVPLPRCLPTTEVAKEQIATFKSNFLLPLATYSRNAQPVENLLMKHYDFGLLDSQSDVKLDLLFAFFINYGSPLRNMYRAFVNSTTTNFAEMTRPASLVLINDSMWKIVGTPSETARPRKISIASNHFEGFLEEIITMFEEGLNGNRRDAKRAAVFVTERFPAISDLKRALAALQRYDRLKVKSFLIYTGDLPYYMEQIASNAIKLNTTDEFGTFLDYTSPVTVDDLCGVAGAPGRHFPFSNFSVAPRGAWPWLATVLGKGEYDCDGVVVHSRWVVTGGDCFEKASTGRGQISGYDIGVRVGQYELNNSDSEETANIYNGISAAVRGDHPAPQGNVTRPIRKYKPSTFENNIALLRLNPQVIFTRFRRPICSPRDSEYNAIISDEIGAVGQTAFVVGYQYFKNGERVVSNVPIESSVVIASLSECKERWPQKIITDSNLCARGISGGVSYGATGTPLMCQDSKTNRYVLCGVGSFGFEDCKDGYAVYTNMRKYEEMIRDTVRRDFDPFMTYNW